MVMRIISSQSRSEYPHHSRRIRLVGDISPSTRVLRDLAVTKLPTLPQLEHADRHLPMAESRGQKQEVPGIRRGQLESPHLVRDRGRDGVPRLREEDDEAEVDRPIAIPLQQRAPDRLSPQRGWEEAARGEDREHDDRGLKPEIRNSRHSSPLSHHA